MSRAVLVLTPSVHEGCRVYANWTRRATRPFTDSLAQPEGQPHRRRAVRMCCRTHEHATSGTNSGVMVHLILYTCGCGTLCSYRSFCAWRFQLSVAFAGLLCDDNRRDTTQVSSPDRPAVSSCGSPWQAVRSSQDRRLSLRERVLSSVRLSSTGLFISKTPSRTTPKSECCIP
jgi:hypothetical protein